MKKILPCFLAFLLLVGCGDSTEKLPPETERLQIVTTIFPAYDLACAAAGDLADVTLLLPPGAESHSYEPTPADILAVQDCDLFICLGGESDSWIDTILSTVEQKGETMRMVDCVELLPEETDHAHDHGHEHDDHDLGKVMGMDEHVWTSPCNAADITLEIGERLAILDEANSESYRKNADAYAAALNALDQEFADFFESLSHRTVVFGDRFPLRYFAERYDLDYYAAFPSCGTQTEPSAATIAFLTELVRDEKLPVVWYIEFSNHLVADSIAEAAGVDTAMFHACHNVTQAEMDAGVTCLSLMKENLATLRHYLT